MTDPTATPMRRCASCRAALSASARFCGACGRPTPRRRNPNEVRAEQRADTRHSAALMTVFIGTLVAIAVGLWQADDVTVLIAVTVAELLAGLAGVAVLARGASWRRALGDSLAAAPPLTWLTLAPLVGVAIAAVAIGWVDLVHRLAEGPVWAATTPMPPLVATLSVTLIPLTEEWLCRGVMWRAAEPLAGRTTAVWLTATLFALLHGLNGGFVLELPHRFVGGIALGWLRSRSGSLAPPIVAHAVWNLTALTVG